MMDVFESDWALTETGKKEAKKAAKTGKKDGKKEEKLAKAS
jgi:hypothetical protein